MLPEGISWLRGGLTCKLRYRRVNDDRVVRTNYLESVHAY